MKKAALSCALLLSIFAAHAQQSYEPKPVPGAENPKAENDEDDEAPVPAAPVRPGDPRKAEVNEFCLFKGLPPSEIKFREVGKVKQAKGTYGSAKDIVPPLIAKATARGANAIANYSGAQHFGFWPWRMVRPVVQGTAITLLGDKPLNCSEIGGTPVSKVLESGQGPEK